MLTNGARDARSDFALTRSAPNEPDSTSNGSSAAARLPDQVARIWDRLELRDRAMIVCLESIVRSVRMDGTANVEEVAHAIPGARGHLSKLAERGFVHIDSVALETSVRESPVVKSQGTHAAMIGIAEGTAEPLQVERESIDRHAHAA